jgi:hypothetical protein
VVAGAVAGISAVATRAAAAEAAELAAIGAETGSAWVGAVERYFVKRLTPGATELWTKLAPYVNDGAKLNIMRTVAKQIGMKFPFSW